MDGHAVSILKEFEDKNTSIKVEYDNCFRPKDASNSLFYMRCALSGHLNGEPIEPLVGVGSGSKKKIAKAYAAEIVVRMLIEKRYIQLANKDEKVPTVININTSVTNQLHTTQYGFAHCPKQSATAEDSKLSEDSHTKLVGQLEETGDVFVDTLSKSPLDALIAIQPSDEPVNDRLPFIAEPSVSGLVQFTDQNAISILKEFEDRNINIKVDYHPDFRPKDAINSLFYERCSLSGHLNGKAIEPLVGIGSGSRKKIAKTHAAEIVVQMLLDKMLLILPTSNEKGNVITITTSAKHVPSIVDDSDQNPKQIEEKSVVVDVEDSKLVDEVEGCYKKLCEQLEGSGKKVFVDTLSKGSIDDQIAVKTCILSIRADNKSHLEFDPDEQCWHGHHLNADIAKDIAAHRALVQLDKPE